MAVVIGFYQYRNKPVITPVGLKIKRKPAFQPVSENFEFKWNSITFNAECSIVQLLFIWVREGFQKKGFQHHFSGSKDQIIGW